MKTDVIIIGAELDGLVAATRLQEYGYSIRVFSTGSGSLHYASEGIHVLGYSPSNNEVIITAPLDAITQLDESHPYRKIGANQVKDALNWFVNFTSDIYPRITINGLNEIAVSPAGLGIPVYGITDHQATFGKLNVKNISIIQFRNYRDFPADLIAAELRKAGIKINIIDVDPPGDVLENAALAKSFDALFQRDSYFLALKGAISKETEIAMFPSVMGYDKHKEVLAFAEQILGVPCLEIPTLPPSVPGMRLEHALTRHLKNKNTAFHTGTEVRRPPLDDEKSIAIWDDMGRRYEANVIIVSSGGVLMGGLDVDSHGWIHETSLGLDTFQSEPLNAATVDQSLNALHIAGVETDNALRPQSNGSGTIRNIFVTGRTLAHWNPAAECSTEGVCIATGWTAAENAHRYMEARNNG